MPNVTAPRIAPPHTADCRFHITAPSRLHFGLLAFGDTTSKNRQGAKSSQRRLYGGVGVMVRQPLVLQWTPADTFSCCGLMSDRVEQFAGRWRAFYSRPVPSGQLQVLRAPPQHVGLGVGTQLGLSVATVLNLKQFGVNASPRELAISVGRGQRSAVGTYGFAEGGMIVDRGKLPTDRMSAIDCRLPFPSDWRLLLLRPCGERAGLSGDRETQAFVKLPAVPVSATQTLRTELRQHLVPAAAAADFAVFSHSLYRYGHLAGSCFASVQGSAYNGPHLQELVHDLNQLGVRGVGQSSWGPTIFAVTCDQDQAQHLANALRRRSKQAIECEIVQACNQGVVVSLDT